MKRGDGPYFEASPRVRVWRQRHCGRHCSYWLELRDLNGQWFRIEVYDYIGNARDAARRFAAVFVAKPRTVIKLRTKAFEAALKRLKKVVDKFPRALAKRCAKDIAACDPTAIQPPTRRVAVR